MSNPQMASEIVWKMYVRPDYSVSAPELARDTNGTLPPLPARATRYERQTIGLVTGMVGQ